MKPVLVCLLISALFTAGCGSQEPSREQQIQLAVAGTLSSLPRNTPVPPPTPMPTFTPMPLSGLYCEYQFCIGHPADMAFYDVSAAQNQAAPSTFSQGILAAYKPSIGPFIQLMWQPAPGSTDPQFMLDLITQYGADTKSGDVQPKLVGPLNVFYVPITPNAAAASALPYGGAAAWLCGGRAFAWKIYAAQQELATALLNDALSRFRCEPQ